jgi:ethanolamine ammonia-lyase small subunit
VPMCFRKQRTTRQVADGEDCHVERHDKKDGTFEQVRKCTTKYRSEPVDDEWCTFRVRSWQKVDEVKATGSGLAPAWPESPLRADTPATFGARRQGARGEKLVIDFGVDTCTVDDAVWRKYRDGQKVKVEVRARSGDIVCSSL